MFVDTHLYARTYLFALVEVASQPEPLNHFDYSGILF